MLVTANRDFISAQIGDITTGQTFDVDNGIAVYWIGAGLVSEFKPKQWEQIEVKPHIEQEVQVKKSRKRKDAN